MSVDFAGLKLSNPTVLASGILGESAKSLIRVAGHGAGAVTTKSIGLHPRSGHINPTVVELQYGLLNAIGLPTPGLAAALHELRALEKLKTPVIASIFGSQIHEVEELATAVSMNGAAAIELNLSCPHAAGYGAAVGSDPEMVYKLTRVAVQASTVPVFAKLTPNVADLVPIGAAAVRAGCAGLVAINTLRAMAIEIQTGMPILSATIGGYSGPGIKPIGVRCVYELASARLGVPILGLGGITTGEDALEYIMAGATAVGLGTAVYYDDLNAFRRIAHEIAEFMQAHGYNNLAQIRGIAIQEGQA